MTNCVIHEGLGYGMQIINSGKVTVKDTQIVGFFTFGLDIESSSSVTVDNVYVADIKLDRKELKFAGFAICSVKDPDT